MDDRFCVSALEQALRRNDNPEVFNTDQGAQFTSKAFTGKLLSEGITISMDGKGRAMDNIFIERLWRSVKYEEIYLKEYFEFCNSKRPHQSLQGRTPLQVHLGQNPTQDMAA